MKAAAFDYRRADSLLAATELLAEHAGRAKLMSGSQSFGPMLNLRLTRPQLVVDISRLSELAGVRTVDDQVEIGAGITHATIEDGLHAALRDHPMRQVAAGIAYRAVRTRGTLGGSLAHADPAADWIVTLTALDARLTLRSPRGTRTIALEEFMHAAYTTALEADEAIAVVHVPQAPRGHRWGYHKLCRKPGEFAEASAAVWQGAGQAQARIVLGALDGAPLQLPELADRIARHGTAAATRENLAAAVRAALPDRDAVDHQMHAVCLARALTQAGLADVPAAAPTGAHP